MKFITRKGHSVLDYVVSLILVTAPFIGRIDHRSAAFFVPVILGLLTTVVSIFTVYEGGLVKVIPFRTHLVLDVLQALILGFSPWLFHFSHQMIIPFVGVAMLEIGVVLCTNPVDQKASRDRAHDRLSKLRNKWDKGQHMA